MDNEKLNNEELEITEETAEAVEEVEEVEEVVTDEEIEAELEAELGVEETAEAVEEIAEEAEEDAENTEEESINIVQIWQCPECETVCDDAVCSVCGAECELIEIEATAGEITEGPRKSIGAIIGGAVAAVIVLVVALWYFGVINPYEIGYVDVFGITLEEAADKSGYTVNEFKKKYSLPWLMPKSTNTNAVDNYIPVSYFIDLNNKEIETKSKLYNVEIPPMTIESFREEMGLSEKITEKSPIGKVRNEVTLRVRLGLKDVDEETAKQEFDKYKKEYGLGKEVTLDTLYKEVRVEVDKKTREKRIEQEKAAEEAKNATPTPEAKKKNAETAPEAETEAEEPAAE